MSARSQAQEPKDIENETQDDKLRVREVPAKERNASKSPAAVATQRRSRHDSRHGRPGDRPFVPFPRAPQGHDDCLKVLKQGKADLNKGDHDGWTPAHYACVYV